MEDCQLRAARTISGAKKGTKHKLIYEELSLPTLEERRHRNNLIKMHTIIHKKEPPYLYELLPNTINAEVAYNLRNRDNMREFLCRTEKFKVLLSPIPPKNGINFHQI